MYKGFNLSGLSEGWFGDPAITTPLKEIGQIIVSSERDLIRSRLDSLAKGKTVLDGAQIQRTWFPQISADVFLSHSHRNEDLALVFAGWLFHNFGLKSFVDSAIWGYADDLLKIIDKNYCLNSDGKSYDYDRRNESTSHVHMMLTTALGMMIHNTECLIFLNTPDSISAEESINRTYSPWIYAELTIAGIVEEVVPGRITEMKNNLINEQKKIVKAAEERL